MPRRAQPGDGRYVWVLTITYRGRDHYWTSRAVTLTGITGRFEGTIRVPPVPARMSLDGRTSLPQVSIEVPTWPNDNGVAAGVAAGYPLVGLEAQLALVPMTSGAWSDRAVIVSGTIREPLYGAADQPVSFEIVRYEEDDRARWPPATWRITEYTFPFETSVEAPPGLPTPDTTTTYTDPDYGRAYPVPWGTPGSGTGIALPAVPAYKVDETVNKADTLLVAGGVVQSTSVVLWIEKSDDSISTKSMIADQTTDAIGQPVVTLDISGETDAIRTARRYWTSWPGGGVVMDQGSSTARTLGQLALWWLHRSTVPVDVPASLAASAYLDGFRLDGWLDEQVTPIEWLSDRLLGAFPAYLAYGGSGKRYIAPIRWKATAKDAVAKLVEGDGTVRRSARVLTKGDGRSRTFNVRWGWNAYAKSFFYTAYRFVGDARDDQPIEHQEDMPDGYSGQTANLMAEWLAWRDGQPHDEIQIIVSNDDHGWLREGDVITYTDAAISLTDQVCLVMSIGRTDGPWTDVELLPVR